MDHGVVGGFLSFCEWLGGVILSFLIGTPGRRETATAAAARFITAGLAQGALIGLAALLITKDFWKSAFITILSMIGCAAAVGGLSFLAGTIEDEVEAERKKAARSTSQSEGKPTNAARTGDSSPPR